MTGSLALAGVFAGRMTLMYKPSGQMCENMIAGDGEIDDDPLTVFALGHVRIATECTDERHDIREQLVRHARREGERLLDTLVPQRRRIDRSAVRSKELRKAEAKVVNTRRQVSKTTRRYGGGHPRRLRERDTQEALDGAGRGTQDRSLVELYGRRILARDRRGSVYKAGLKERGEKEGVQEHRVVGSASGGCVMPSLYRVCKGRGR